MLYLDCTFRDTGWEAQGWVGRTYSTVDHPAQSN